MAALSSAEELQTYERQNQGGTPTPGTDAAAPSFVRAMQTPDRVRETSDLLTTGRLVNEPPRTAPVGPIARIPRAVERLSRWPLSRARFELLQQWEGMVTAVVGTDFDAVLHDLTDRRRPQEAASFLLAEVGEGDLRLVAPGAVFYWNIGYRVSEAGQKERVSAIRFRRLPAWTKRDIERAADRAALLMKDFGGTT